MILNRVIKLMESASKDETRYHLNGVHLSVRDGMIALAATDGHILSREMVACDIESEFYKSLEGMKDGLIIMRETLPLLKLVVKEYKYGVDLSVDGATIKAGHYSIPVNLDVKYPKYEQLIPKRDKVHGITFNAELLMRLAKSLSESKVKGVTLWLDVKVNEGNAQVDTLSPILVDVKGDGHDKKLGVLMPMRR